MDDLISRQAAIDALCAVCGNDCDKSEFVYNAPQDEQVILCPEHYCLCTLPSVQPERKKGEWIRNENGTYSCSICQSWIPEEQHYYARYCLYCGADMRGEEMRKKEIIEKSYEKWEEEDAKKLDIGGRISNILYEERMTQRELAQKCHITEVSMSRYINNTRMPKGTIIVAIAKALGVSADYLLGLSELRGEQDDSV